MSDTVTINGADPIVLAVPGLEEKCRRVVTRHDRLHRLVDLRAPEMLVRTEKRMLKAAVEDLFDDADVGAIVSCLGAGTFKTYFDYIAGIGSTFSPVNTSRNFVAAWFAAWLQAKGEVI